MKTKSTVWIEQLSGVAWGTKVVKEWVIVFWFLTHDVDRLKSLDNAAWQNSKLKKYSSGFQPIILYYNYIVCVYFITTTVILMCYCVLKTPLQGYQFSNFVSVLEGFHDFFL